MCTLFFSISIQMSAMASNSLHFLFAPDTGKLSPMVTTRVDYLIQNHMQHIYMFWFVPLLTHVMALCSGALANPGP